MSLEAFYDHFKGMNDEPPINATQYNTEFNEPISGREVMAAVTALTNNKTCGGDQILDEFLKNSIEKLLPVFACEYL